MLGVCWLRLMNCLKPGVAELCNKWFEYACPNLSPAVSAEYRRLLDRRIKIDHAQEPPARIGKPPLSIVSHAQRKLQLWTLVEGPRGGLEHFQSLVEAARTQQRLPQLRVRFFIVRAQLHQCFIGGERLGGMLQCFMRTRD